MISGENIIYHANDICKIAKVYFRNISRLWVAV